MTALLLEPRQDDACLRLILALFVLVADFAVFVGNKKEHLAEAFVRVNLRGERSGVADFESYEAFPFRFERRDVDDDAATRIGRFPEANGQHISWNAEIFYRASQRKRVRRNDA